MVLALKGNRHVKLSHIPNWFRFGNLKAYLYYARDLHTFEASQKL